MKYDFHKRMFAETGSEPLKLAVSGSEGDISWQELKEKVEKLSAVFKKLDIPENNPVIIYGHKEYFYTVAILACIHSSVTYVPADVIYPNERIRKIAEITGTQVIVNCSDYGHGVDIAVEINSGLKIIQRRKPVFTQTPGTGNPLQYIMFTSGSTGEPKGVQILRNSILRFIDWAVADFGFSGQDVFMNQAPFTFDVSLCDLFNAFVNGASLVLFDNDSVKNQENTLNRLKRYNCTVWTSTPSYLYIFLRNPDFKNRFLPALRMFLLMGEELHAKICESVFSAFPQGLLYNAYGPTEATIVTTLVKITGDMISRYGTVPIGYPMPGSELFIDSPDEPAGEGELIISGEHVSAGYFKDEILTKSKFFNHNGLRAFRTGDISYYKEGMLFYKGRNDEQVKFHGFRIELGEINSVISNEEYISEAVTIPLKRNNEIKKLVTFIKVNTGFSFESAAKNRLLSKLEEKLPYYMIPAEIIVVTDFPYSASFKIDKAKLLSDFMRGL